MIQSAAVIVGEGSLRFPGRAGHMILPERPVRAALAGLGLYDTMRLRQRLIMKAGRLCLQLRLGRIMRVSYLPAEVDVKWWRYWLSEVAEPAVGTVGRIAMMLQQDRVAALLMDDQGRLLGFAKVRRSKNVDAREALEQTIHRVLDQDRPAAFRVPRILVHGELDGHVYQVFTPLPAGSHKPPPADPALIGAVVDEIQSKLRGLERPCGCPRHYVVGHGDFSPRNLRLARDRNLWLFDWEYAGWTPRLADEVRYWTTWYAARLHPRVHYHAARILQFLRVRATDEEIVEAVCWPEHNLPGEKALRDAILAAM